MKNNKNIKVLFPVVIIIWGIVIYKIFEAFNADSVTMSQTTRSSFKPPPFQKKDTFSLLTLDADPFLGTVYVKAKVDNPAPGKTKKNKAEIQWPNISYFGTVADSSASSSVFILSINGSQHLLKKGDTISRLRILKGSEENIQIRYEGETREFPIM